MTLVLDKQRQSTVSPQNKPAAVLHVHMYEATVLCPKCKAFQTLSFVEGRLVETRKFTQKDGQVFHDCGSEEPCRLYRGI